MASDGYLRAHWNSGAGIWQLEIFEFPSVGVDTLEFSHAERLMSIRLVLKSLRLSVRNIVGMLTSSHRGALVERTSG